MRKFGGLELERCRVNREGVAIDMCHPEGREFSMADEPRRSAGIAPSARSCSGGECAAVAAQIRHGTSSGCHNQAAPRTPLESPWTGGKSRVATRSEKIYP